MGIFKKIGRSLKHSVKKVGHAVKHPKVLLKGVTHPKKTFKYVSHSVSKFSSGAVTKVASTLDKGTKVVSHVVDAGDNIVTGVGGLFKNTGVLVYGGLAVGGLYALSRLRK